MSLEAELNKLDQADRSMRTAEQIFEEARLRIPRYASNWTDFNESDPGIALLQLFAWLTEQMAYQIRRVPERSYLKFLKLLNLELRSPQPAEAHLTFEPKEAKATSPLTASVLPGTKILAQSEGAPEPVVFETQTGLDLIRAPLAAVQVYDAATGDFRLVTEANVADDSTAYAPFGTSAQVGSALYLGFKAPDANQPKQTLFSGRIFPQQMRFRVFLPVSTEAGPALNANEVEAVRPAPTATLAWEYKPDKDKRWRALDVADDETVAFTREGYVLVPGPTDIHPTVLGDEPKPCYWLRCRIVSGQYPGGHEPRIDFIRPNVVLALSVQTVRDELVGIADGLPNLVVALQRKPLQPGSLTLKVNFPGSDDKPWQLVDDLHQKGDPDAHIYQLNITTGQISFGDGTQGWIPPAGAEILAEEYRFGGGQAANVPAGAINAPLVALNPVDKVANERKAVGGKDEQSLDDLKANTPRVMRSRNLALTAENYAEMAQEAGGVAKAKAFSLMNPNHPGVDVPGSVTVVIAPDDKDLPPRTSPELIEKVCRYLNARRPLATELYVRYARYRRVRVEATVYADPRAAFGQVEADVVKNLNDFLNKLGLGVDVHRSRIFQHMLDVADVDSVEITKLYLDDQDVTGQQLIVLAKDELAYGTEHVLDVKPFKDQ